MQHTNPVFQVLVTSGVPSPVVLAKGQRPSALKGGQIGFFNAHTGLSIDATSAANEIKDYYIMVGINKGAAANAADDVQGSAGYYIQPRNTTAITLKGYMAETSKIVEISNFTVLCQTNYCIKLLISNQQSYQVNGFNTLSKTFCYYSGCCGLVDCGDCPPAGSSAEVAAGLAAQINADPDKLFTAQASTMTALATFSASATAGLYTVTVGSTVYSINNTGAATQAVVQAAIIDAVNNTANSPYAAVATGTAGQIAFSAKTPTSTPFGTVSLGPGGTGITISAVQTAARANFTDYTTLPSGAGGILRITASATAAASFNNNIPNKYFKAGTNFEVALTSGVGYCNGTVSTIQDPVFPDGKGVDIRYLEYVAGGWNGNPGVYRQLSLTGLPKEDFVYYSSANGQYNVFVISNDIESVSGNFTTYKNPVATYIAVPCTDSTVLSGIAAVLDVIYAGRFELTADAAALPNTCINPTTTNLAVAASGIEFVA